MFVRVITISLVVLVAWAVLARTSEGAGPERAYVVRYGDTLWTIAVAHYGGDPRAAVWEIRERNGLAGALIRPGERIVLP
ncbi:MAG: LysM peptidoglycan-binding domain-containing protein [Gaiellaceae bacterium]